MNQISDPKLTRLLDELHTSSDAEESQIMDFYRGQTFNPTELLKLNEQEHQFFSDKMVALPRDKACFIHMLCCGANAQQIVEFGTSYGVSTLYLADAVRRNGGGTVIATEYETGKAEIANLNFLKAELTEYIDFRIGDLRETLQDLQGPIDFVLMDIWIEMVEPAFQLVAPHMRPGAMICADNTETFRKPYSGYFELLEQFGFSTMTLPFEGGLELSIKN